MKKIIFITLFAIFSLGSFATTPKLIKAQNASCLIKKDAQFSLLNCWLPYYFVSDCGEIWECTSGCENLTQHQATIIRNLLSDLCDTDVTDVTIIL